MKTKAILMLEDGKYFSGESLGAAEEKVGEVIFNTAVVGYQEMMTDPANANKILVLTYPLIGNYGCAPKFNESGKVWLAGLVIKEKSRIFSNWQAKESFDDFIKRNDLMAIGSIDTRSLTVHLRQKGTLLGVISTKTTDPKELLAKIAAYRKNKAESILSKISVAKPTQHGSKKGKTKIAVLDIGVTNSLMKQLETAGFQATVFPYNTKTEEILRFKPQGLLISGGPEDDAGLGEVALNIKPLISRIPVLGVSTGHQVVCRALGAKVIKMKVGHRGANYPIHNPASYKGEITVQNHGSAVDIDSLNRIKDIKITGYNLNDRSVEEVESKKMKFLGVQYIPACPGFDEVNPVFKRFMKMIKK